ncbi:MULTISPECIES: hypothetical protein [unclassified Streptomyces]|uniref:hypothetical protein n=1 Tax=unclassified Streptomyces TaxID=2593676 RepID=UPI0014889193|nr:MULTISPECIES: hypothetical protein [unclassified Streptomyces]
MADPQRGRAAAIRTDGDRHSDPNPKPDTTVHEPLNNARADGQSRPVGKRPQRPHARPCRERLGGAHRQQDSCPTIYRIIRRQRRSGAARRRDGIANSAAHASP